MSNKKLTFEQAVRSGKDFRCVESGIGYRIRDNGYMYELGTGIYRVFNKEWLDQTFEIIEVKKELTASDINNAFKDSFLFTHNYMDSDSYRSFMKKLGF